MAIDDNTSYELTGAQVKDLASKINAKADTTDLPSVMTGATSQIAGTSGLVPAPTTTDVDKYLKGDGTWATVSSGSQDAVTLYCYWGDSSYTFTPYYDAAHTQAVSYFDFVQLVRTKVVTLMWDDHDGFNYTQTIIASFVDSYDPTDPQNPPSSINFIAAQAGYRQIDCNLFEYTWNSEDSRFSSVANPMCPYQNVWYATSSSSGYTSSKTATTVSSTAQSAFVLNTGVVVFVKFSNQTTVTGNLWLNVDGTGNKQVYVTGTYTDGSYLWNANDVVGFVYDGTYWRMLDGGKATTSSYGKVKLSSSWANNDSSVVPTSAHLYQVYLVADGKQDQLTAGTGITISGNTISATGGSYTYSGSVDTVNNSFTTSLSDGTITQSATLNAGTGITFSSVSSGPSIVGPTPCNTDTDATQISNLTFTPGSASTGYFYVLRVEKSSSMSGDVYSARLYKSLSQFNFTSQAEVEAAIWPTGQQIDVNPNNTGMTGFFNSSFQRIEYVSGKSTAAEAIAAVYTAEATFGGTVTFNQMYNNVDAYVYVMGQGASTLTVSTNLYTTTGQNTDGAVTQKLFTDTVGNIETILQTLNTGTGV